MPKYFFTRNKALILITKSYYNKFGLNKIEKSLFLTYLLINKSYYWAYNFTIS